MEQMTSICDIVGQIMQKKEEERRIVEEQAAKDRYWKIPICYDDDEDYTIAITPVLSTKEPVDPLIMEDKHLDTIPATESNDVIKSSVEDLIPIPSESKGISDGSCDVPLCDNPTPLEAFKEHSETIIDSNNDSTSSDDDSPYGEDIDYVNASPLDAEIVILEVVEIVVPEVRGVDTDIILTIKDDILCEKFLNVNLVIANIEALKDNPTPSSNFVTKPPSTFPNSLLEETNTFDNSLTESETFRFNLKEISSGSTTTRSDYSFLDYEAFYLNDDHIEEKSSGSTTTNADFSLPKYDSFIFDLSINPFPPADRSDFYHEEFTDELARIISPPDLECFYFKSEPDLGDLTSIDPGIRENVSTTNENVPIEDDQSPLFAFVVWIFLAFLTYPVVPPYLLSCGNEDTIFDPGIPIYHSFMPAARLGCAETKVATWDDLAFKLIILRWNVRILNKGQNKDKTRRNRAREWEEREITSPTVLSDFIEPARNPFYGDAGKKDDEGVVKESGFDNQERSKNSTQDVNTVGPSINTASTNANTGSLNINTVSPTVTTAPLEATHADFFGDDT
ncbi:hypothetical protein Tco_0696257 [Tanacetum coccineum]